MRLCDKRIIYSRDFEFRCNLVLSGLDVKLFSCEKKKNEEDMIFLSRKDLDSIYKEY